MKADFEKDVMIDPDALDVEWLEQPRLMLKYGQIAAEAKNTADNLKEALDSFKAGLDLDIRKEPEKFGIAKITEGAIQSAILQDDKHKELSEELANARYEAEMAKVASMAISTRKDALENLVRLFGMQYFAGPNLPRDLNHEWEAHIKDRESNSKVKIQQRAIRRGKE